jgi:uncharacterized protein (DUF1697 family)
MVLMELVVFLRAVNLGPSNKVSMDSLRTILTEAGFSNVRTYLNSGNLTLQSVHPISDVTDQIRNLIKVNFGFEIDVFVYSIAELRDRIDQGVFALLTADQIPYVVFMDHEIAIEVPSDLQHIHLLASEETILFCYGTISDQHTSFPNALIEKKYKVRCTSRNLNTIMKILQASKS